VSDEELLPCPFCKCDEIDAAGWKANNGETGPSCIACGATAETVALWNSRPFEAELAECRAENERLTALVQAHQTYNPKQRVKPNFCEHHEKMTKEGHIRAAAQRVVDDILPQHGLLTEDELSNILKLKEAIK
jgi:hypothetical protein